MNKVYVMASDSSTKPLAPVEVADEKKELQLLLAHNLDLVAYRKRCDEQRHHAIDRMARMEMAAGTYDKVVLPEVTEER